MAEQAKAKFTMPLKGKLIWHNHPEVIPGVLVWYKPKSGPGLGKVIQRDGDLCMVAFIKGWPMVSFTMKEFDSGGSMRVVKDSQVKILVHRDVIKDNADAK